MYRWVSAMCELLVQASLFVQVFQRRFMLEFIADLMQFALQLPGVQPFCRVKRFLDHDVAKALEDKRVHFGHYAWFNDWKCNEFHTNNPFEPLMEKT